MSELGKVSNGTQRGRAGAEQITFFKSAGLTAQDVAAAQQALTTALQKKLGSKVNL